MPIESITTLNFRNLSQQGLHFDHAVNVIYGPNGAGKTSLLEAIYSLTTGRSFRTQKLESIISHNGGEFALDAFVLHGSLIDETGTSSTVGLKKSKTDKTKIKVNGEFLTSSAQLACICPTLVIEPESFNLLSGASQRRRRFIDWGVFHVEHGFVSAWRQYSLCLKQRNALLRQLRENGGTYIKEQVNVWDQKLSEYASIIDDNRRNYFEKLREKFAEKLDRFDLIDEERLRISYRRGWDKTLSLAEALAKNLDKDTEKAYTSVGPHRMDVRITNGSTSATETLSRGQQKLVVLVLYLAQVACLSNQTGRATLLLLDDLEAELDENNSNIIFSELRSLGSQIICTSLHEHALSKQLNTIDNYKVFHVEHGHVSS